MVDRRRSSSLLKSINFLPVQKEVVAETKLEGLILFCQFWLTQKLDFLFTLND